MTKEVTTEIVTMTLINTAIKNEIGYSKASINKLILIVRACMLQFISISRPFDWPGLFSIRTRKVKDEFELTFKLSNVMGAGRAPECGRKFMGLAEKASGIFEVDIARILSMYANSVISNLNGGHIVEVVDGLFLATPSTAKQRANVISLLDLRKGDADVLRYDMENGKTAFVLAIYPFDKRSSISMIKKNYPSLI